MDAFITRRGGAGAGLNFKVVGGTAQPTNPKENTIWVNTPNEITRWIFRADEPDTPETGMVWISTGESGVVEFNALKENGLYVHPIEAKQYISGEWEPRVAMIYQGDKWIEWLVYLYKDGELKAGRLIPVAKDWSGSSGAAPAITYNEKSVKMTMISTSQGYCYFPIKFDMTRFNTLKTIGAYTFNGAERCGVAVLNSVGGAFGTSYAGWAAGAAENSSLDVSEMTGEKYIGFFLSGGTSLTFSAIWLE